jgi:hypothetical protein
LIEPGLYLAEITKKCNPYYMNPATVRAFSTCLTLALITSAMPSCKKRSTSEYDPNGTKLAKVIITNSSQAAGEHTITCEYHYDNLNRVIEIAQHDDDSIKNISYFYNTNEQLPYKCVDNTFNPSGETYYFYDNNGRLVTDSTITNNGYTVRKYNWSGTRVLTGSDSCVINTNNITAKISLTFTSIGLGMPAAIISYDNKINPLNTLNIHAAAPLSGTGGLHTPGYSKNNITEAKFGYYPIYGTPGFKESSSTTYTYKYNTAGLPVECEISWLPVSLKNRIQYYYTD